MGFNFDMAGQGTSSGGPFAWGEFVRDERRLDLHFRHSLGMVRYHIRDKSASHESYMREIGLWEGCEYPGFSADAFEAFRGLAHDLGCAEDFTSGDATVLLRAAAKERASTKEQERRFMTSAVGDLQVLREMKARFQEKRYEMVIGLADELKYPSHMGRSERRMVQLAKEKIIARRDSEY